MNRIERQARWNGVLVHWFHGPPVALLSYPPHWFHRIGHAGCKTLFCAKGHGCPMKTRVLFLRLRPVTRILRPESPVLARSTVRFIEHANFILSLSFTRLVLYYLSRRKPGLFLGEKLWHRCKFHCYEWYILSKEREWKERYYIEFWDNKNVNFAIYRVQLLK